MWSPWVHKYEYYLVPLSRNLAKYTENNDLSEVGVGCGHFSMTDGDVGRLQRRYMIRFPDTDIVEQRRTQIQGSADQSPDLFQRHRGFFEWGLGAGGGPEHSWLPPETVSTHLFLLLERYVYVVLKTKYSFLFFWPLSYIPYSFIFNKQFQIPYFFPPKAYK